MSLQILASIPDANQLELTFDEGWFLDFFRRVTAQTIAVYYKNEFWQKLVHQACATQVVVRHSAIAIGALHWSRMSKSLLVSGNKPTYFVLNQFSKVFRHLHHELDSEIPRKQRMEAILISCGILVSSAFAQGDAQGCGCHFRAGYELLNNWQRFQMDNSSIGIIVLKMFNQVYLDWPPLIGHAGAKSHSYPLQLVQDYQVDRMIETPEDACGVLTILGWLTLQMRPLSNIGRRTDSASFMVLEKLNHWKHILLQQEKRLSESRHQAFVMMDMWSEVVLIKCLSDEWIHDGEMRYDNFLSHFQRILQLGEDLALNVSLSRSWALSGIVTPLFYCAFKCRDWITRRKAISLLQRGDHEQGIWSFSGVALVLDRLVGIESEGFLEHEVIAPSSRIDALHVDFLSGVPNLQLSYRRTARQHDCGDTSVWGKELIEY
ncbi:hypothetical protein N7456_001142 [Penicillium angulare]|uniref:Uncharacterized protein n=1 Tax=Penicillium angulare TaxID=116970 RepID=A0A9W9KSX3_9EURO|nr:hypothetical protein N7456_001142 [Penicillium angulare]